MRGFLVGTAATAITFAVVAYFLPQIDYGDNLPGLIVLAVIAGVVNGFIKPIVKLFSLPITMMTLGPVRARHQRRAAAADRVDRGPGGRDVHGRRLPARLRPRRDRRGLHRRHRDHPSSARSSPSWSTTERRGPAPGHRGGAAGGGPPVRHPRLRHRPRGARRGMRVGRRRVPRPDRPPVLGQGERRPGGDRRGRRARVRGQRRLARRMGARAARGRPERADHARGDRQDPGRPARRGPGRGRRRTRCAGSPSSRPRRRRRSPRIARRGRARRRSTSCTGSTRTWRRRRWRDSRSGPAAPSSA